MNSLKWKGEALLYLNLKECECFCIYYIRICSTFNWDFRVSSFQSCSVITINLLSSWNEIKWLSLFQMILNLCAFKCIDLLGNFITEYVFICRPLVFSTYLEGIETSMLTEIWSQYRWTRHTLSFASGDFGMSLKKIHPGGFHCYLTTPLITYCSR